MINRSEIINIMKEGKTNISRDNVDLYAIKKILEKTLEKLNSVECITDTRFIPYGRMELLIDEFENEKNKVANDKIITKDEYHNLFETDDNDAFVRLIIPANEPTNDYPTELNLIGKLPQEFTTDEIIRIKNIHKKCMVK